MKWIIKNLKDIQDSINKLGGIEQFRKLAKTIVPIIKQVSEL